MTETTTLRLSKSNGAKNQYESPKTDAGQTTCNSVLRNEMFGGDGPEFLAFEFMTEDPTDSLELERTTKNYGVYEHSSGAVEGFYIHRRHFADREPPESLDVRFEPTTEDSWDEQVEEDAVEVDEEAAAGLMA